MNPLLKRQIQKYFGDADSLPTELERLFDSISEAYEGFEQDRNLIERSLDISSNELREVNQKLRSEVEVRKQIEQSVLEREKFLSDILESIQDGISVLSPDLDIVRVNSAMNKNYKHMLPLEGKKCYKAYQMRDEICEKCPSVRALETGHLEREEVQLRQDNEVTGTLEVFAFPMLDTSGEPSGVVEYVRDITKRKEAEYKQAKLLEQVLKANEELIRFAYVITHDLKSPLRGISTLAEWIRKDHSCELSDQAKKKLEQLSNRTKRMHSLIDGLLEYTRIQYVSEKIVPVDLNKVIQRISDSLMLNNNTKIKIARKLPVIECEQNKITRIFLHLIENAVKFLDKKDGYVEIQYIERPKYWQFSISDNGPGIDKRYFEKIFKMFQTLERWEVSGDSGIGLALVKRVVEVLGGNIWVESNIGQGSVFHFTIPKNMYQYASQKIPEQEDIVIEQIDS